MGRESGQTAAEYLGVLVVIAAIVVALVQTDTGTRLRDGIQDEICKIAGGDCATETASQNPWAGVHATTTVSIDGDGGVGEDDDLPTGPAFGDGEFPVPDIPWAGSVSANGEAGPDNGLYVNASVTEERSACTLSSDGEPQVDLSVTGSFVTGARGETPGSATLGVDAYTGRDVSWQISTDPESADRFQDGVGVPSPVDPSTIPEGTTLTLDESTYEGLNLGAAYKGVGVTLGREEGQSVSSSVERVDPDTVRVTVGDSDYINDMGAIDLGLVSLGPDRDSADFRAKQVDLDLSTAAGRKAYGDFISSGTLPAPGTGVTGITDISSRTLSDGLPAVLEGPAGALGIDPGDQEYEVSTTTRPDGTKEYSIFDGGTGNTRSSTWAVSPDGTVTDGGTTITYAGLGSGEAEVLEEAYYGSDRPDRDGDQDLSVTFTQDELRAMQDAFADAADYHDANADDGDGHSAQQARALRKLAETSPDLFADWLQGSPTEIAPTLSGVRADAARQRYYEEGASEDEARAALPTPSTTAARPAGC